MNTYEFLKDSACRDGIYVIDYHFSSPNIKGLYADNTIAINKALSTQAERACILAEELGHHYTSAGNILDQNDVANRKQEFRARVYGYNLLIGLRGIIQAYEAGCRNLYEIAEHLDVTEEYLKEALECYRKKHGTFATLDNYAIYFEPTLGVMKLQN